MAALPTLLSQASSLSVPDGICLVYLTLFQTQGQAPGQPLSTAATWKSVLWACLTLILLLFITNVLHSWHSFPWYLTFLFCLLFWNFVFYFLIFSITLFHVSVLCFGEDTCLRHSKAEAENHSATSDIKMRTNRLYSKKTVDYSKISKLFKNPIGTRMLTHSWG